MLRHLQIPTAPLRVDFAAPGSGRRILRMVPRAQQATALRRQIASIEESAVALQAQRITQGLPEEVDLVLQITSAANFPFSPSDIHALTTGSPITLLYARSVRDEYDEERTEVILHVPWGSLNVLAEKARRYGEEQTSQGGVPFEWMANVQGIAIAALKALWTDVEPLPEDDALHWWELWIRRDATAEAMFQAATLAADIRVKQPWLRLPERIIVVAEATRAQLEGSILLLNALAEVRRARVHHLELGALSGVEQHEWVQEATTRLDIPADGAPVVCIIDTGINRGHPLLTPLIAPADNRSVLATGDASDSWPGTGHGTLMAGLAAYGDLRELMGSTGRWRQTHRLEGVKLFDPDQQHEPENYGAVTQQAIFLPEAIAPERSRAYSLALTAEGNCDGRPSAWSAAIDAAAFGAEEQGEPKRLIFVSAGNVQVFAVDAEFEYPSSNHSAPIEDPAQAWNAVTVGAVTRRDEILEDDPASRELTAIAPAGSLSPYSRTGYMWDTHWPIKPEIVMEGGNVAFHPGGSFESRDSLEPLSCSKDFATRPLATLRATSAATALAARLAAQLQALYPDARPETIRGLLVHSARWSDRMLGGLDPFQGQTPEQRWRFQRMLRSVGYGEPDPARAAFSSNQAVTLLREDTFSPYRGSAGNASLNDCHIHNLGLPADLLRGLLDATCQMRVTLSYFTAPNPSTSNRIGGSRYRYGGCLLRFRVRHKDEDEGAFERRVSREAAEDAEDGDAENLRDPAWALGPKLRGKGGSIVHDIWQGNAADLAQMDRIAVFPVKGWWASRSFPRESPWHHCHRRQIRYSLVVSVESSADIELYNAFRIELGIPLDA